MAKIKRMYYLAYGSNMNCEQMRKRCPENIFIKKAYLKDYKFIYDDYSKNWNGAVGNVVESKDNIVWGVVFEITEKDLKNLDKHEGYPEVYNRKQIDIYDNEGNVLSAIVYLREKQDEGKPSEAYENMVIQSAREHAIPEKYIEKYLKWNKNKA